MGAVYRIVRLVVIDTSSEGATANKMQEARTDVVSVGGELSAHAEGLAHGRGKHNVSYVGEAFHLVQFAVTPVGAGVVEFYQKVVSLAVAYTNAQFVSHAKALFLKFCGVSSAVVVA